jgi:hypothetical protein
MFKAFQTISISLLLLAATGSVWANPGERQAWREEIRAERQQRIAERQGLQQRREFAIPRVAERPRAVDPRFQPVAPAGSLPLAPGLRPINPFNVGPNVPPEEVRHPGRMTLEERRELRRQINEAGRNYPNR